MADRRSFSRPRTAGPPPHPLHMPTLLQSPGLPAQQPPSVDALLYNSLLYSTPGNPNFIGPSQTLAVPQPPFGFMATLPNGLPFPVGVPGPVASSRFFGSPNLSFNPKNAVGAPFCPSPTSAGGVSPSCPGGTPGLRLPNSNPRAKSKEILDAIERAVQEAQQELLAGGEDVTTWKITQAALLRLNADSLESLGFRFQEIPTLRKIMSMESKVNAFIHCFVAVRRIVSLHDLDVEICKSEGVGKFEELGMGSLLRQPLIQHYFSVPSDTKEIFKISSEQIIYYLSEFIVTCKEKDIRVNKFLEFMMEKFSIGTPEKLCIRVHGLGLYIALIKEARKTEIAASEKFLQTLKHDFDARSQNVDKGRPPSEYIQSQKQKLDKRFNDMSDRIVSFSSINKDFKPKHIRFVYSSSDDSGDDAEDDDNDENNCSCGVEVKSSGTKSSCPYPSAEEERTRLGLNAGIHGSNDDSLQSRKLSGEKRKSDCSFNNSSCKKKSSKKGKRDAVFSESKVPTDKIVKVPGGKVLQEKDDSNNLMGCKAPDEQDNFNLTDKSLQKFITTWKESCREQSTLEVFNSMLLFYKASSTEREHRKIRRLFSSYPWLGLLNVAVSSMKRRMWDSLYDSFQVIDADGFTKERSTRSMEVIEVEPSAKCEVPSSISDHIKSLEISVCADDICKMIIEYFRFDVYMQGESISTSEKKSISLRGILGCETWIAKKFSVENFAHLGYGEFIEFLDKYMPSFSSEIFYHFFGEERKENSTSVSMHKEQLSEFLSQTMADVNTNHIFTTGSISILLKKQFPLMSLQVLGNNSDEEFIDILKQMKLYASRKVVYSAALLESSSYTIDSLVPKNGIAPGSDGVVGEFRQKMGSHGAASGKDAIECLLKAPMLSDLLAWSHWEILYGPSLGPLLEWLSNECYNRELLCLVTRDGKVIRIDHSATIDGFLEAAIHASSFKTAVSFLSILALYGGTHSAPLNLLKCHACHAIEVILKNDRDLQEINSKYKFSVLDKASPDSSVCGRSSYRSFTFEASHSNVKLKRALTRNLNKLDRGGSLVAKFILDFLFYLPSEFRTIAGEIFLFGLRSSIPDAYSVILCECTQADQLMMLHDLGLSLGIIDWINHYHVFTTSAHNATSSDFHNNGYFEDLSHTADHACDGAVSKEIPYVNEDESDTEACNVDNGKDITADCVVKCGHDLILALKPVDEEDAYNVIESIRREEFGLDSSLACTEASLLKKQHARLGRALCCLSRDLYSQDSHFILELVQNADDNVYSKDVDATLAFILQPNGIVVLNNEQGFTAENIRALCDVGNSTKKGSATGYIGHKGIGFKSVFRVTDAPEIHSNGYHVKFDISEGQIGFVLPTAIPPRDVNLVGMLVSADNQADDTTWNTCIVLPFKPAFKEPAAMRSILSMFSDLHPSLLLFLHRLQCIKLKNMINDSLTVLRREKFGNGIVTVTHGDEKMTWLVVQSKLNANNIRPDVQTTEIALAFTLKESSNGEYQPQLIQQPVFAFLPLRTYGLKFILQGDFVLPSSREEVDGNSPWNQWLLSKFPGLFFISERSFCDLPCFKDNPAKAVSLYMAFVPLMGEVHGFFSSLPQFIISRLRMSNCLLLDKRDVEWVLPCRVLKGWNNEVRLLLPDKLLHDHLGLGYLHKDILLSDSLSEALGVQSYGPSILIDILRSICTKDNVKLLGLNWLVSWLCVLHDSLLVCSSDFQISVDCRKESDYINDLKGIPFLPLSDGSCSSLSEGPIWLPCDMLFSGQEDDNLSKCFPTLYAKLRTVDPALFTQGIKNSKIKESQLSILVQMLLKVGVQRMSAHELVLMHILPTISGGGLLGKEKELMVEYLVFIMHHMQSNCSICKVERTDIIAELQKEAVVLTNSGFKCPILEPVHFGKEFKSPIDMSKLIGDLDLKWNEVDCIYLNHSGAQSLSLGVQKWREFFEQLGVTDFVQIKRVYGNSSNSKLSANLDVVAINVEDWECPELLHLLFALSSKNDREKCMYLLSTLDMLWDDIFGAKVSGYYACASNSVDEKIQTRSSSLKSIHQFRWIASSLDKELHFPANMFYNCEAVMSILGADAPYAVPQVNNKGLVNALGFKIQVTIRDALMMLHSWQASNHFNASIGQMSRFYSFIWNEISKGNMAELELLSGPLVFVPLGTSSNNDEVVAGAFLSPGELCWQDPAGVMDLIREINFQNALTGGSKYASCLTLCHVYPHLHDFFVKHCLVTETPKFGDYVNILRKLSGCAPPSQAAATVLRVLQKWADDIKYGLVGPEEISSLKECLSRSENTVLPTVQDKWVCLHPDFGCVCWCDDEDLKQQFTYRNSTYFLYFGLTNSEENQLVSKKLESFMQAVGIPALSEIVFREAVFYGLIEGEGKFPLISWLLPYVQRYLYRFHREAYSSLKKTEFQGPGQLKVITVESLFYRRVLKGCGNTNTSKMRFECSCLLQGNILYLTKSAEYHSIFLELSRLFFGGSSNLHLANFLHMITTMAESGSTQEQIESFVVNGQMVPKLPDDEQAWVLDYPSSSQVQNASLTSPTLQPIVEAFPISKHKLQKPGISSQWPPTNWRTCPSFRRIHEHSEPDTSRPYQSVTLEEKLTFQIDHLLAEYDSNAAYAALTSKNVHHTEGLLETEAPKVEQKKIQAFHSTELLIENPALHLDAGSSTFGERVQLHTGNPSVEHAHRTGRVGELIAFKYFVEKHGRSAIKWVNEDVETGLPYDIIITEEDDSVQYIEVKATSSTRKDWFEMSANEWLFAVLNGDSYSIARVVLCPPEQARISLFKNPVKLCQKDVLRLAILMPRNHER